MLSHVSYHAARRKEVCGLSAFQLSSLLAF